jgi:hypothetical protein
MANSPALNLTYAGYLREVLCEILILVFPASCSSIINCFLDPILAPPNILLETWSTGGRAPE